MGVLAFRQTWGAMPIVGVGPGLELLAAFA
jgi:hypothetical protein